MLVVKDRAVGSICRTMQTICRTMKKGETPPATGTKKKNYRRSTRHQNQNHSRQAKARTR